jgi:hypothetical protein
MDDPIAKIFFTAKAAEQGRSFLKHLADTFDRVGQTMALI